MSRRLIEPLAADLFEKGVREEEADEYEDCADKIGKEIRVADEKVEAPRVGIFGSEVTERTADEWTHYTSKRPA